MIHTFFFSPASKQHEGKTSGIKKSYELREGNTEEQYKMYISSYRKKRIRLKRFKFFILFRTKKCKENELKPSSGVDTSHG